MRDLMFSGIMPANILPFRADLSIDEAVSLGRPFYVNVAPVAPHFLKPNRDSPTIMDECPATGGMRAPVGAGNLFGMSPGVAPRWRGSLFGNPLFGMQRAPSFNEADVSDKPAWIQQRPLLGAIDMDCLQKQDWRRSYSARRLE